MMLPDHRYHHVCHLFANSGERDVFALAFLDDALAHGDACLVVTSPHAVEGWVQRLGAGDIDVQRELRRGALTIMPGGPSRTACEWMSIAKAGEVLEFIRTRLGFRGVRILADFEWGFSPALPSDLLCHWEATADLALEDLDVRAVCQYDLQRASPSQVCSALRTHRMIIIGAQAHGSPFFEAPSILENEPHLNHSFDDRKRVELMLSQLTTIDTPDMVEHTSRMRSRSASTRS
jgi:hypothetical protein